jgi:ABC-type transport system involved in multi-copper enzyme maturation permease subunit
MCAFKKDEVHVKQFSWKLRIVVSVLCVLAVLLLVYLASYSFANLNPFITILLIFILLLVCGMAVFVVDVAFSREWE